MEKKILIVGYGVVGKNLSRELEPLHPDIVDKYKPEENRRRHNGRYDIAFICVDTPMTSRTPCDTGEVRNAVRENYAEVYVIKSTVLPGTTEEIARETGQHMVFSPEYYGGTQHCNNFGFPFTILGGQKADCIRIIQALMEVYDARHTFRITDSRTAEYAKYMENAFLATKVSFCQEFYRMAEKDGVDYEELRELFILDPRVGASHTFVYRDKPYWDSHCLNKDVPAIAEYGDSDFLKEIVRINERAKEQHNM